MVLPIALGILSVLSISAVVVLDSSSSNARSASYSSEHKRAEALAEAGVNNALSVLFNPTNNTLDRYLLPEKVTTYEGGTATWSGSLNENAFTPFWTLTSTGRVRNPTGTTTQVARTMTAIVKVDPVYTQPLGSQAWNYIFSTATGDPSGCDSTLSQNVEISTRFYLAGNLCLENGAWVSAGPLLVHGKVTLAVQSSVGKSGALVTEAHIAGGCAYKVQPLHTPCSSVDNVWASQITATPQTIAWPTADWDKWYLNGSPGPYASCVQQTGTPPTFDNDAAAGTDPEATRLSKKNRSVAGTFNLTGVNSYKCSTAAGSIEWKAAVKQLTVNGTIYIDGNVVVDTGGVLATYDGFGTIYTSGSVLMQNATLCAVASGTTCDWAAYNPNNELLAFAAAGVGGQTGVAADTTITFQSSHFQGGFYGAQKVVIESANGNPELQGPIVSGKIVVTQAIKTYNFPMISTAPAGLPGNPVVFGKPRAPESFSG